MTVQRQLAVILTLIAAGGYAAAVLGKTEEKKTDVVTREIHFHPDRVYEVTGIWVAPEKLDELGAYFGKVFPIAATDYGVTPLFALEPQSAYAGDFLPPVMFVNEWPSLEKFKAFVEDPRAKALFVERDAVVSRLVVTQYSVPAEATVTLSEGDVVELAAMWITKGREEELRAYYQEAFPLAVKHGARPITPLKPVFSYRGEFVPTQAGLNLWPSPQHFDAFAEAAAHLFPRRDAALDRLAVTHAKVRFDAAR